MEDASAEAIVQESIETTEPAEASEGKLADFAPPSDPPEESGPTARQFAALARREREIREKERTINEQQGRLSEYESAYKLAQEDPVGFLKKTGVSEDQLIQHMVDSNGAPTQDELIRRQAEQIQGLKAEFAEYQQKEKLSRTQQSNEEQWNTFVDNTRKEVENSEGLTLVKDFKAHQLVADVILEYHKQHGELLPVAEAGKLVEEHITNEAEKFFKNDALKKHYSEYLTPAEESSKSPDTPTPSQRDLHAAKVPRTLTNTLAASTPNRSNGVLSEQDSLDRMVDTLRWSE
tara:strand:+ start:791 stop:1663 length:873 start_codon:yes stop_codon:yes gene_type:complete